MTATQWQGGGATSVAQTNATTSNSILFGSSAGSTVQFTPGAGQKPTQISAYLTQLQANPAMRQQVLQQLYQSGYWPSYSAGRTPSFNILGLDAQTALERAASDASRSNVDLGTVLGMSQGANAGSVAAAGAPQIAGNNVYHIDLTDPAEIRSIANKTGQAILGRKLTDSELMKAVGSIQGTEKGQQMIGINASEGAAKNAYMVGTGQAPDPNADASLDDFMHAIGQQESGGNYNAANPSGAQGKYQILASNWPSWAKAAGLPSNAPKTPENQEIVAKAKFKSLYAATGDWRKVASAWYSGNPNLSESTKPQKGGPSIKGYVDSVIGKMGTAAGVTPTTTYLPATISTSTQTNPTADVEEQLRSAHPVEAGAHDIADVYSTFQQLLKGTS